MRSLLIATALLALSCSSPTSPTGPAGLHDHINAKASQVTPIYASPAAMPDAVAKAVAAQSLQVVERQCEETWGRISAVDAHGFTYVLSWEPAVGEQPGDECVLLMISCQSKFSAVPVGQLAQAVREAAEGSG